MSFADCVQRGVDDGLVNPIRGKEAQDLWRRKTAQFQSLGHSPAQAAAMAAEIVKKQARRDALIDGHRLTAHVAWMADSQKRIADLAEAEIGSYQTATVENLDYQRRGLMRYFNGRLAQFLKDNHKDWKGSLKKPAQMMNIVREMHGEATGDATAKALADGISAVLEEARAMHNAAGGYIGKMDGYFPHSHNATAIRRAGQDAWVSEIIDGDMIDWTKMEDFSTGEMFQTPDGPPPSIETQRAFLEEIHRNIVYGKDEVPAYGKPQGKPVYKRRSEARVLHFKGADAWMAYNKRYGSGDAFGALMGHIHAMSSDIAAMREFGPNPKLGLDYRRQLINKRVRDEGIRAKVEGFFGDAPHAERMMNLYNGPSRPEGTWMEMSATFFSNARHLMTAAFLDKAVVASISDFNSMRLAAQQAGISQGNVFSTYGSTVKDMVAEGTMATGDLLRHQWVLDTLADPGATVARFQMEHPASEVFERMSAASMRVQGLTHHTDSAKFAFQSGFWGAFADNADRALDDIDPGLRKSLTEHGITADEWDTFRAGTKYEAGNGATFLNPLYWRAASDLDPKMRDDIFFKFQGLVEKWTEVGVPTNSLKAKAFFDPVGFGLPPGHPMYEIMKSAGMFKSFVAAFTINQYRMLVRQPTVGGRISYAAQMIGGATFMGALALQIGEIIKGNDPADMTSDPVFWGKAMAKGGGAGIIGDIVATGQASWGGGFGSYVAGPMPQAFGDAYDLTIKNAYEFATGQDTKFAKEFAKTAKRYTPMAETPALGPALDRLIYDNIEIFLDPDGKAARERAAQKRSGGKGTEWWPSASPTPARLPSLAAALGG